MRPEIKERLEQIKRGEVPEGYQKAKNGVMPEEWEQKNFNKVIKAISRKVSKPKEPYWSLGIRSHAKGTFYKYVEDPNKVGMDELYVVKEDDLILNITFAWEHAIAVAGAKDDGKLVSHRFPTYVFTKKGHPLFYKYFVMQPRFKYLLSGISPGGAGRNRVLNKKSFLELPVLVPPFKEQKKIAAILSTWDRAIELKEQQIEEKQKLKKWLMQNLLTGKKRLPGFEGEWEETLLGDIAKIKTGDKDNKDKTEGGKHPFFVRSDFIERINSYSYDGEAILIPGDGRIGQVYHYINGKFDYHQRVYKISDFDSKCLGVFVYYYLSKFFLKEALKYTAKATVDSLRMPMLINMRIKLPIKKEQIEIVKILIAADNEIELLNHELTLLKQQKKGLMQILLSGIVRVPEAYEEEMKKVGDSIV